MLHRRIKRNVKKAEKNKKGRYIRAPRRKRASTVTAGIILAALVAVSVFGILEVDKNTRAVGWNEHRTELAFAANTDRLDLTVLNQRYDFNIHPADVAYRYSVRIKSGFEQVEPSPARLWDMLLEQMKPQFMRLLSALEGIAEI